MDTYTGEGKGGPDPLGGNLCLRQTIPSTSINLISSFDIPNTPPLTPMTNRPPKQLKQRYYYIFWSIATLAVVIGQIYVASSYKQLAEALKLSLL